MAVDQKFHKKRKRINVALQGGGAHGAFTWGVLERLMGDDRLFIDGLSGTSAGAMNAVVFTDGFVRGRQRQAIASLYEFWHRVSRGALLSTALHKAMAPLHQGWNMDQTLGFQVLDAVTRMFSPYELNPFDLHPLRDILEETVDFEGLRKRADIKLFVAATNVRTCKLKVFRTPEITVESLLASACLPLLFRAVEIDGESYWDGGYLANPPITPLITECVSKDVVIIQINPMNRNAAPTSAREILNRVNEISFNSSLVREMNGIATLSRLINRGRLEHDQIAPVNFHLIQAEAQMRLLGSSSKFNADWSFLSYLHDLGVETADRWLTENFDRIGHGSTLDMFSTYE
jgi:NTE family protein